MCSMASQTTSLLPAVRQALSPQTRNRRTSVKTIRILPYNSVISLPPCVFLRVQFQVWSPSTASAFRGRKQRERTTPLQPMTLLSHRESGPLVVPHVPIPLVPVMWVRVSPEPSMCLSRVHLRCSCYHRHYLQELHLR